MGKCLREVADLPAPGDVVLLSVQAKVVAQGEQPLEQLPRLGLAAVEREQARNWPSLPDRPSSVTSVE